jgi:hypothetical protein
LRVGSSSSDERPKSVAWCITISFVFPLHFQEINYRG